MNKLEQAIEQFANDSPNGRENFYAILLQSEVWVPLSPDQPNMAEGDLSLQLVEGEEDELLFVLFSSEANFKKWLESDFYYTVIPSVQILQLAKQDACKIVLDPAGPHTYEFTVEEVNHILAQEKPAQEPLPFTFLPTEGADKELKTKLLPMLAKYPEIKEGYLGLVQHQNSKRWVLGVYFATATQSNIQKVLEQLKSDLDKLKDQKFSIVPVELTDGLLFQQISEQIEVFYMNY